MVWREQHQGLALCPSNTDVILLACLQNLFEDLPKNMVKLKLKDQILKIEARWTQAENVI